jgi:putative hydrolase of the HAD superfamily
MNCRCKPAALVLDAMGVIYSVGDDVADLLCPFICEYGGQRDRATVESLYREASLGRLSASDFWRAVQLDPAVENDYLQRLSLSPDVIEFLCDPPSCLSEIWCLSNDVSEWSRKLRERFGLGQLMRGFVISGDVGARKPDAAIFQKLFAEMSLEPSQAVLVDDRQPNLDAAQQLGMETILFAPHGSTEPARHRQVSGFRELRDLLGVGR